MESRKRYVAIRNVVYAFTKAEFHYFQTKLAPALVNGQHGKVPRGQGFRYAAADLSHAIQDLIKDKKPWKVLDIAIGNNYEIDFFIDEKPSMKEKHFMKMRLLYVERKTKRSISVSFVQLNIGEYFYYHYRKVLFMKISTNQALCLNSETKKYRKQQVYKFRLNRLVDMAMDL